jgi:hypothetical protein
VSCGAFAGGMSGFLAVIPLGALLLKAVLLLAMAPLVGVGARCQR